MFLNILLPVVTQEEVDSKRDQYMVKKRKDPEDNEVHIIYKVKLLTLPGIISNLCTLSPENRCVFSKFTHNLTRDKQKENYNPIILKNVYIRKYTC
jgi:hypothetical protein